MRVMTLCLLCLVVVTLPLLAAELPPSINALLGYQPTDKLLIINGDDAGMCHTANLACMDSLERGLMTGTTIMVPCPWFPEMAAYAAKHPEHDFGVHITLTSEWKGYKWGPVLGRSAVPKLCDKDGYLWPDVEPLYAHGDLEQAYQESKAQIEKALAAGIDITHLDCHMGCLQYSNEYFEVYLRLAKEYNLPLREGPQRMMAAMGGGDRRARERAAGILAPDDLVINARKPGESVAACWKRVLRGDIKPGCTEIFIHPNLAGEESKAITGTWQDRATEYELFTTDPEVRQIIKDQRLILVTYRQLREAQRKLGAAAPKP